MILYGQHTISKGDKESVLNVMDFLSLTQGPVVPLLEARVSAYVGARYVSAVSSATAGLILATKAIAGDKEFIGVCPEVTFVATANAVVHCGGTPVFCDVDPDTGNISLSGLTEILGNNRNGIVIVYPVHLGGKPVDMRQLKLACSNYPNVKIIEDASHALGAFYAGGTSRVGSCEYSDATVFSLHPVKNIAAGEGGLVTTSDPALFERVNLLRSHGIRKIMSTCDSEDSNQFWFYEMESPGFNYRITDLQASLALSQLERIETFISRRREIALAYVTGLKNIPGIRVLQEIDNYHALHLCIVRLDSSANVNRNTLMNRLRDAGIVSQIHYIPVTAQPFYVKTYNTQVGAGALCYYKNSLSIPLHAALHDIEQEYIIYTLRRILCH